jgi:hypothetical protein
VNNAITSTQSVTCGNIAIAQPTLPVNAYINYAFGNGANTASSIYAFKHVPLSNCLLKSVSVIIPSFINANNVGNSLQAVLLDASGNLLASGSPITITGGMLDVQSAFAFNTPFPSMLTGSTYYIGLVLPSAGYYPIGVAPNPDFLVSGYYSFPTGGSPTQIVDQGFFSLEATIQSGPAISIAGTNTLCSPNSVTLFASGAQNYTWSTGQQGQSIVVSPFSNAAYTASGSAAGCVGSGSIQVTVYSPPFVFISNAPPLMCGIENGGSPFQLSGNPSGGTFGGNNVSATGMFTPGIAGLSTVTYSYTNAQGCAGTGSAQIQVSIPTVSVTMDIVSDFFCTLSTGGLSVQCYGDPSGGQFSGNNITANGVFNPSTAGTKTLTYKYTDSNTGCFKTTSVSVQVASCAGLNEFESQVFSVYPNPSSRQFVRVSGLEEGQVLEIRDLQGRIFSSYRLNGNAMEVDVDGLSDGVYIFHLQTDGGNSKAIRFILIR